MSSIKDKKLFLLDMDGTIYLDTCLFDGAMDFLQQVKENMRQLSKNLRVLKSPVFIL